MAKKKPDEAKWRNRIVGHADLALRDIQLNAKNWRTHPDAEKAALDGGQLRSADGLRTSAGNTCLTSSSSPAVVGAADGGLKPSRFRSFWIISYRPIAAARS